MIVKELDRAPLVGAFNANLLVRDRSGGIFLKRVPKENLIICDSIDFEYFETGFNDEGGGYRRRTPEEQARFTRYASNMGLRVLPSVITDKRISYTPFLENSPTLDVFLPQASQSDAARVTYQIFDDLRRAHKQAIIYGDRWSKNILVAPNLGAVNIDFDIELSGLPAVEFEVAQAAYYVLCGGREKVMSPLSKILANNTGWFRQDLVEKFLSGHARHFSKDQEYGNVEADVDILIESTKKVRNATKVVR